MRLVLVTVHAEERQTQHWRYLLRYRVLLGSNLVWPSVSCGNEKNGSMAEQRAVPLFQWCFLRHRVEKIIAERSQLRPSGSSNRSNFLFEHLELKLATLTARANHLQVSVALVMRRTPTHPRVPRFGSEDLANTSSKLHRHAISHPPISSRSWRLRDTQ